MHCSGSNIGRGQLDKEQPQANIKAAIKGRKGMEPGGRHSENLERGLERFAGPERICPCSYSDRRANQTSEGRRQRQRLACKPTARAVGDEYDAAAGDVGSWPK
jgi:hypothetical protein